MPAPDIIAMGGGDVTSGETLELDREFIARTGKSNPTVLFVPTGYCDEYDPVKDL